MTHTMRMLFGGGVAVAGLAGPTGGWGGHWDLGFALGGIAMMFAGACLNGLMQPSTALLVVVSTNAAFWLSFGLWRVTDKVPVGIDPYAGIVALWLVVLMPLTAYEGMMFIRGMLRSPDSRLAAIGLIALVL